MKPLKQPVGTKRKYWLFKEIYTCPLCGHEKVYREKRYDEKPKNPFERYKEFVEPYHCGY